MIQYVYDVETNQGNLIEVTDSSIETPAEPTVPEKTIEERLAAAEQEIAALKVQLEEVTTP